MAPSVGAAKPLGDPHHRCGGASVHHVPRNLPRAGGVLARRSHRKAREAALAQSSAPRGLDGACDAGARKIRLGKARPRRRKKFQKPEARYGADGFGRSCRQRASGISGTDRLLHLPRGISSDRRTVFVLHPAVFLSAHRPQRGSRCVQSHPRSPAGRQQDPLFAAAGSGVFCPDAL